LKHRVAARAIAEATSRPHQVATAKIASTRVSAAVVEFTWKTR
jgi:hypothetical protein